MNLLYLILYPVLFFRHRISLLFKELSELFIQVRQALCLLSVLLYLSVLVHRVLSDL